LPQGCFLAGRCPLAIAACRAAHPPLFPVGDAHSARCIRLDQT
jgi:ABC-type dipeptide/oligopeptide/nickel transport system ATPase component